MHPGHLPEYRPGSGQIPELRRPEAVRCRLRSLPNILSATGSLPASPDVWHSSWPIGGPLPRSHPAAAGCCTESVYPVCCHLPRRSESLSACSLPVRILMEGCAENSVMRLCLSLRHQKEGGRGRPGLSSESSLCLFSVDLYLDEGGEGGGIICLDQPVKLEPGDGLLREGYLLRSVFLLKRHHQLASV